MSRLYTDPPTSDTPETESWDSSSDMDEEPIYDSSEELDPQPTQLPNDAWLPTPGTLGEESSDADEVFIGFSINPT